MGCPSNKNETNQQKSDRSENAGDALLNKASASFSGWWKAACVVLGLLLFISVFVWGLGSALGPLLFAFAFVYLCFPLITKLEAVGVPRALSVPSILVLFVGVFAGVLVALVPYVLGETKALVASAPEYAAAAATKIEALAASFGYTVALNEASIKAYAQAKLGSLSSSQYLQAGGVFGNALQFSVGGVVQWFLGLLNIIMVPMFFFYVALQYEAIVKSAQAFVPKKVLPKVQHYTGMGNRVLSGYIRGQFTVALVLAALYGFGLWALGLEYGLVIGILAGLCNIIPYLGLILGLGTALVVALATGMGGAGILGIVGVFALVQTLEGFIITPKLVGDKVGLNELETILALIIGGNLLGILGMLVAIPTAAVAKCALAELKQAYQELNFNQ